MRRFHCFCPVLTVINCPELGLRTKTMSALRKKRAKGKPCVGLCYITKLEKMEKRHQRRTKIRRKMMDKMSNQ